MTTTERDLRAFYADPPGLADVERRLLASIDHTTDHTTDLTTDIATAGVPTAPTAMTPRVRTWTATGLNAAAVAAAAVTALVLIPHSRATPSSAGAPTADPAPAATVASEPSSAPAPAAATTVTLTPQVAVQTLISLLPRAGSTTRLAGTTSPGWAGGTLVYDDGAGAVALSIGVSFPYSSSQGPQRLAAGSLCSSPGVVQLGQVCRDRPDGSQVAVYQGDANIPGGAEDWEVSVLRADGVQVDVTEWNSPTEKGGDRTRSDPPFTPAELTAIASSDAWAGEVSARQAQTAASLFVAESTG